MTAGKKDKPLLLLFDGNALIHRAFHALPPLSIARTGEMVSAVRGFAATLLKLLKENKPTYWAIAFDRPTPTFRHIKFADYKKHRPPTPPELVSQIGRVHQLAEAFHLPAFEIDGYEADDVLGTLGKQASGQGIQTLIVTGDNDMLQIVSSQVNVMTPRRSFSDTVIYDESEVQNKYGVLPKQLIDLKALIGDTSDNIPGIPGVGDKTAAKLIQQFGTLENVYAHIEEVTPPKLQALLRDYKEQTFQSRELATIVTDVPVTLDLEKCRVSDYDRNTVVELFRELEFVRLLPSLPDEISQVSEVVRPPAVEKRDYHIITTEEALDELIERLVRAGEFAIDTETSSLNVRSADIVGISVAVQPNEAFYIPVGHRVLSTVGQLPLSYVAAKFKPLLSDMKLRKVAHNGKFDMLALDGQEMKVTNLIFDTMIAAYLLGEKPIGLKALAFNKLGIEMMPIEDLIGKGAKQISMALVEIERAADYACADADMTVRLKQVFEPELHEQGLWRLFDEVEMPLVPVLEDMERTGVALDSELLRDMSGNFGAEMARLEQQIYSWVGHEFNINSSQQLSRVLFDELKLSRSRKTKCGFSTDASVLEELKDTSPVIELLLQYRQLAKLKSTYTDAFLALVDTRTGRIHTSYNQTGTTTGRLSSSEPNLQNLPIRTELGGKIRQAIVARPGWCLLSADYSQIDLRALAHISQDADLIATFERDEDVHASTASKIFSVSPGQVTSAMRRAAKTVNFGVIYGMSDYGLEQATDFNREEAAQFITSYFEKYPGVKEYIETTKQQAKTRGYVQTVLGRRRYIPEINSSNRQLREAAERMAINMPVQGTSADIIKIAMINLYREINQRGLESKMILQVHDELVFEVAPAEVDIMKTIVLELMPDALKLDVPLKVDIKLGNNWGEVG